MSGERVDFLVQPAKGPLKGSVPLPGDKSVGHRGLIFGALSEGKSELSGFTAGEGNLATMSAMRALGAKIEEVGEGRVTIEGRGLHGLVAPQAPIDCGGAGTTIRLLAGLLAGQRFSSTLAADQYLSKRPMARVVMPLRRRGARIEGRFHPTKAGEILPPLVIEALPDGQRLTESEESLPIPTAQVKSALLLSGLYADGATYVREPLVSRDHTERLMAALGVPIRTMGPMVELDPAGWSQKIPAFSLPIVGDFSAAAFLLVAASIVDGSEVSVRGCGINPTRTGLYEYLRDHGARVAIEERGDALGEPVGVIHVQSCAPVHGRLGGELLLRAIDEVPIACAYAARASGVTEIVDAAELRVKETDRVAAMAKVLRAFGVSCEERPDGMSILGRPDGPLSAAVVDSEGDHRIAMTAAVLALVADGETRIRDVGCVATSFPRFAGTLRALGADIRAVAAE